MGDLYTLKVWLLNLGTVALIAGELAASKPLFAEALRIAHQIDDRVQQAYLLDALGCHAARSGQARLAAQLLGAADTVRTGAGAQRHAIPRSTDGPGRGVGDRGAWRIQVRGRIQGRKPIEPGRRSAARTR